MACELANTSMCCTQWRYSLSLCVTASLFEGHIRVRLLSCLELAVYCIGIAMENPFSDRFRLLGDHANPLRSHPPSISPLDRPSSLTSDSPAQVVEKYITPVLDVELEEPGWVVHDLRGDSKESMPSQSWKRSAW